MPTATTTVLGHVERAIQFFNEPEIFIGFGKTTSWADEANPPLPDPYARNIGMVVGETYTGASLTSANCFAKINRDLFTGGSVQYQILALTATTYEVRRVSDNTLMGNPSYATQAAARNNIITGVDITVSGTITPGHTYVFTVDGAIGFKKVVTKHLVIPDSLGTITYGSQNYLIVDEADAYDMNARWVYIETSFEYNELPLTDFRQLGVFIDLERGVGVTSDVLVPSQVASSGAIVVIDNRRVVYRDADQKEIVAYIIEH